MKIVLTNSRLFYKKVTILFVATVVLVPLIHYKLQIPATIYLGTLLFLHVLFLYIYFSKVPWREFLKDKKTLILRLTSILFFIYLLALLHFDGATITVLANLIAAFSIHVFILLMMMAERIEVTTEQEQ